MKRNRALDKIPLSLDVVPAITTGLESAGDLFNLIEKALPSEQERLIRLGLKQAQIMARAKKKATRAEINAYMDRIKAKKRALREAKRMKLPLDDMRNDLLILLNEVAD